jgi:homoserine O-acetyltransferase
MTQRLRSTDANDFLFQYEASRDYDPSGAGKLERIQAPVLAINSSDDQVNPPELGLVDKFLPRVKNGKYVLIPISDQTRGHGTHSLPAIWGPYLAEFLKGIENNR